ncbi:oligosaccharide flippase family protein [Citrobacter portucalensis]|uniref:oligosaccharide flippase family protein n=1 Tax=Citrobacter portucalensis TaxID=1639133 RepID=UPI003F1BBB3F
MLKKNIFYLFIVQGGNYLIPLITFPYLLRVLGPVSFGLFGFFQATIQYFILFIEYGFNWTATETVAKNKNNTIVLTKLFWGFFWAKSLLAIISVILLFVICMLFDIFNQNFIVIIAFLPLIIGNVIYPVWFFQGIEEMKWITISTLLARIIVIPMTFVFVRDMGDVWIAALIQSCAVFLSGLISIYIIARGKWISGFDFDFLIIKKCLTDGWHLFVSTSAISLYTTSTAIILGAMISPIAVGYYNAANTIRGATQGLLNPIAQAIYPRICFMISNNYNNALQLKKRLLNIFVVFHFFVLYVYSFLHLQSFKL